MCRQTVKFLFKKARDEGKELEMALLEFQNTPIMGLDESPAMSRHLQSHLPRILAMLKPWIAEGVRKKLEQRQQMQKSHYDKWAKALSELKHGDIVRYQANKS